MTAFLILSAIALALAVISCLGGGEDAYTSLPMLLGWGATACAGAYCIIKKRLYRRPAVFSLHMAFLLILVGALATHLWGTSTTLHLRVGEQTSVGDITVTLDDFSIVNYPGTQAPADYVSRLTVDGAAATVAMNKVYTCRGYRFFQTAYDPDGCGTILTVTHDPVGTAISYAGYAVLMLSMALCVVLRAFSRRSGALLLLSWFAIGAGASPRVLPAETADAFGLLAVYSNGRVAPLSTLARDFSVKLTGSASYRGLTPEQVLTGWLFFYDSWKNEPCIKISDKHTRLKLGIEGKYASLADFFSSRGEYLAADVVDGKANELFGLASAAAAGSLWTVFPVCSADGELQWFSPIDASPADNDLEKWHFVSHCFNYLAELAALGRWEDMEQAVGKIAEYQRRESGQGVLPSPMQVDAERLFVGLASSVWPAVLLLGAGIVLFFVPRRRVARFIAVLGFLWLAFLVALNWIASGTIPMANGYETMQWMALAACCAGVVCSGRYGLGSPLCLIVAALAMMVAMMGQRSPQITQVVPVLRSPLLSVHVLAVMLAYAALAIMALCGAAWLLGRRSMLALGRALLEPAVFLLSAGIFIGAVWANQSWGRYWGWDPKEVWALITMVVYCLPLHTSTMPAFRCDRFFAIYSVAAFLSVIMTYFGVNFILGGLHGYA